MKISTSFRRIAFLSIIALAGCARNGATGNLASHPAQSKNRREVTGSHIPKHVGQPVATPLAASLPYEHAADTNRDLGIVDPPTATH